jgi:hypothetical protein
MKKLKNSCAMIVSPTSFDRWKKEKFD